MGTKDKPRNKKGAGARRPLKDLDLGRGKDVKGGFGIGKALVPVVSAPLKGGTQPPPPPPPPPPA